MSLIEEALRKQAQEEGRSNQPAAAGATAAPSLPVVAPVPAPPQPAVALQPVAPPQPAFAPQPVAPQHVAPPQPALAPLSATPPSPAAAPRAVAAPRAPVPVSRQRPVISSDASRQRKLSVLLLAGVGLLVVMVVLGAIFLLLSNWLHSESRRPAGTVREPVNKQPPAAVVSASAAAAQVAPAAAAPATVAPAPVALPVAATASVPIAPVAPVAPVAAGVTTTPVVAGVTAVPDATVVVAPVIPPEAPIVNWPAIKINGLFTSGGKTVVLFGDGVTLETGGTAPGGIQLLDVVAGAVRLSYKGQVRTYRRNGGSFVADTKE